MPAVYRIRNTTNGLVYIGSAVDPKSRWRTHRCALRKGTHDNSYLQRAWNSHGESAFVFEVLEEVSADMLLAREAEVIAAAGALRRGIGYNLCAVGRSQLGLKHTPESRQKMSEARKGQRKSPEHQASINAALRGRRLSDVCRAKLAEARRGTRASDETRAKMRASQAARQLTEDQIRRMQEGGRRAAMRRWHGEEEQLS